MRGIYILAIGALALVGCKRELHQEPEVPVQLAITPVMAGEETKSASTDAFASGDLMGLWVTASARTNAITPISDKGDNYTERTKYTHNGTAFLNQEDKLTFPSVSTVMGLYSVYPYYTNVANAEYDKLSTLDNKVGFAHVIQTDQTSAANFKLSDVLTATRGTAGITAENGSGVVLKYYHRMALVKVKVKVPSKYGDDAIGTTNPVILTQRNAALYAHVPLAVTGNDDAAGYDPSTLDPAFPHTGTSPDRTEKGTVKASCLTPTNPTPDANGMMEYEFELISVPQTYGASSEVLQVQVDYAGTKRDFSFVTSGLAFKAGVSNTLALNVNNLTPINMGDVTLAKWQSSTSDGPMNYFKTQNSFTTVAAFVPAGYTNATLKTSVGDFPVKVSYDVAGLIYTLKFDLYNPGPKDYPFTVTNVVFSKEGDAKSYSVTPNITVTQKGAVAMILLTATNVLDYSGFASNCYVAYPVGGSYPKMMFNAFKKPRAKFTKGNSTPVNGTGTNPSTADYGLDNDLTYQAGDKIEVSWQTAVNHGTAGNMVIKSVALTSAGIATVEVNGPGNAVLSYKRGDVVLWNYHIWATDSNPFTTFYATGGDVNGTTPSGQAKFMDRNLGALSATATKPAAADAYKYFGVLYQHGRPTPFTGQGAGEVVKTYTAIFDGAGVAIPAGTIGGYTQSNTAVSTVDAAIKTPNTYYYKDYAPGWSWFGVDLSIWSDYGTNKSIFDPCPYGYRVPNNGSWNSWTSPHTQTWTANTIDGGAVWSSTWWPAAGRRENSSGALNGVGNGGYCWSSTYAPTYYSYNLYFRYSGDVYPSSSYTRSLGFSVRCVQEGY